MLFDHNLGLLATSSVKFIGQSVMQRRNNSKYAYIWGETTESICRLNIVRNPAYLPSVLKWTAMFLLLPASIILGYMVWVSRIRVVKFRAEADKARYEAWAAMASYMAHKTKTPLANIRLSSQNLQQELEVRYGELPQDLRHYFQTFTGDVDRAFKSLQSIIKFARAVPPRLRTDRSRGALAKRCGAESTPAWCHCRAVSTVRWSAGESGFGTNCDGRGKHHYKQLQGYERVR